MHNPPLLDGLRGTFVETDRLRTHIITGGTEDGDPVIFVHGNLSAARFFEETMAALPPRFRSIAPDLRGYGRSETRPVDATRGLRDFSDDLHALIQTLGLRRPHLVGWSLGGDVVLQYAIDHADNVASLTLIAPGPPYGFGGTRDLEGTPTTSDFAGSGAGRVHPEFLRRLAAGDRSDASPFAPRNMMNARYFKPPFRSPREEIFLDEILMTACGEDNYPGDIVRLETWPGVGPGTHGVDNALSPKYCNLQAFTSIKAPIPVLWVRGDADNIVSDTSLSDIGYLGQIGVVPGWPGPEVFPPQPMVSQIRAFLDRYAANGGRYQEVVLQNCGHSPHIEQPEAFRAAFFAFLLHR
ncbi:MAG: alpha/beta hydrolase [Pseudomonadota bacterium]|nr:alpha/beta hydrolase [Pseudomonadota bacterium]